MADMTDVAFEHEVLSGKARDRGRNYVRHLEQLDEGKRGARVTCRGCALDTPETKRPKEATS